MAEDHLWTYVMAALGLLAAIIGYAAWKWPKATPVPIQHVDNSTRIEQVHIQIPPVHIPPKPVPASDSTEPAASRQRPRAESYVPEFPRKQAEPLVEQSVAEPRVDPRSYSVPAPILPPARPEVQTPLPTPSPDPPRTTARKRERVTEPLFEDEFEVDGGTHKAFVATLSKGDKVKGIATEQDGDPFSIYVMDEEQ